MGGWRQVLRAGALTDEIARAEVERSLRFRKAETVRADVADALGHLTQKAGALLGAQAIFIVVDTWGMEHNWPRLAVLVSIVLLVLAALIVLTLLRSVYLMSPRTDDAQAYEFEQIFGLAKVLASRAARFNVALLMTFLSVILLGFGAVEASYA